YPHGGCLSHTDLGMGRLDTGMYLVHTVVTKTAQSTYDKVPNQSIYSAKLWQQPKEIPRPTFFQKIASESTQRKYKQLFKSSFLYPLWAFCKLKLRRQRMPIKPSDCFSLCKTGFFNDNKRNECWIAKANC